MAIIMATYDLRKPNYDYSDLYRYLKTFTYCWHIESVWLLDTDVSVGDIRDGMQAHIHEDTDKVFVAEIRRNWASFGFPCASWLKERSW